MGTCLAFRRQDTGRWGGAVCLDGTGDHREAPHASSLVGVTLLDSPGRPSMHDFLGADVSSGTMGIVQVDARSLPGARKQLDPFHDVGQLKVRRRFKPFLYGRSVSWDLPSRLAGYIDYPAAQQGAVLVPVAELIAEPDDRELATLGELFVGTGFRESADPGVRYEESRRERRRYVEFLLDRGWIEPGLSLAELKKENRWTELIAFLQRYCCTREGAHPHDKLTEPVRRYLEGD